MALQAALVEFASPASSGTVDVTSSGFGTPQAAMVWGTHAPNSTVPNRATDVNFYIGFWANDGSNTQDGLGFYVQDGVSTSNAQTRVGDGAGILADGENEVDDMAVVTTAITDGIRIQFNGGYSQRYFALLFSGAADFSLATFDNRGTSVDLSLGHEPHVAFCLTSAVPSNEGATLSDGGMGFGVLHFDGTTLAQLSTSWIAQDAFTTTDNAQVISDSEIGRALSYGTGDPVTASRPSADTLRLETVSYGSLCAVLAFELDDPDDFAMGLDREDLHTNPDDDGATQSVTIDTGWEPAMVGMIGTRMTSTNAWYSGYRSIGFCIGADDGTNGHCASWRTQDGQSTERAHSLNHDKIYATYKPNDDTSVEHEASIYSLDSDGFTIAWDEVVGDRPYFIWWAVKASSAAEITGTGALESQSVVLSGAGKREITASGTLSVQNTSIAGSGVIGRVGTGSIEAQVSMIAGEGIRAIIGTGVLTPDPAVVTGAGVKTVTASGALLSSSCFISGVGNKEINSTGVLVMQSASITATGFVSSAVVGTGELLSQSAEIAATGVIGRSGLGVLTAQNAAIAGTGVIGRTGTGALAAQSASISGTGYFPITVTGTGAMRAQPSRISASGRLANWSIRPDASSNWTDATSTDSVWTDKTDSENTWNT